MEVMLEIYRTLKALKMEWRTRGDESEKEYELAGADGVTVVKEGKEKSRDRPEESDKKRRRREEEERVKKAQELYFVETRCRMDDVMVRFFFLFFSLFPSQRSIRLGADTGCL